MKNPPLVSIIMNCLNGEKYLKQSIDSVLNQSYSNWELVFLDNASTDSSATIVKNYNESRIKYLKLEQTVPLGLARNIALDNVKGEFLCLLDTDDIFISNKLEIQVEYMLNNPDVILGYTNCEYLISDEKGERLVKNEKKGYTGNLFSELITKTNFIYLCTIIINVRLAEKELRFKPEYQITEEYELFLRLSLKGKFVFSNVILGKYRIHPNSFMRKSENNVVYFNERLQILEQFKDEIKIKKINIKKTKDLIYYNSVLRLIREGEISSAKKYIPELIKSKSLNNILIFIILKLNLGILYKYYFRFKHH